MRMSAERLYNLLPAIHRLRDAAEGEPLRELVAVLAEQAAVLEEHIEQLYDDQFIETCADWVAPYIGGLIGYRPLHGVAPAVASPRAEVSNTIAYRRRLGTASVLEQLAHDVTGWPARAVEYFQLCATTQRMNHIRPQHALAPDLRQGLALEHTAGAFERLTRTAEMRSIARAGGRWHFANVGLHLWRLQAFVRADAPATTVDAQRHGFSPLGAPLPLFQAERAEVSITHLAEPWQVPAPITRRVLWADLLGEAGAAPARRLYGRGADGALQSLMVSLDGVELGADEVECCNLADDGAGWAHMPAAGDPVAIDPVLGRLALPPDRLGAVRVSFHQGFSAPIGGGPYPRAVRFAQPTAERPRLRVPADHPDIQTALAALPAAGGIVELLDNGHYAEAPAIDAAPGAVIELRAADGMQPHLALTAEMSVRGGAGARVTIDGLLISGFGLVVPGDGGNALDRLSLRHCTLVPGLALDAQGQPRQPGAASIRVALPGTRLELSACVSGRLGVHPMSHAVLADGIVDAAALEPGSSREAVAYADEAGTGFGGALTLDAVTVFGKLAAVRFDRVSDSILEARLAAADPWPAPVWAERRQQGCMRFSFVPEGSRVPRRYRCQPQRAIAEAVDARERQLGVPLTAAQRTQIAVRIARRLVPGFTSRRYGRPAYGQLRDSAPEGIRGGASDEGEMGAFHGLYAPQRETNLRIRLDEYLRFALEAGAFHES